ncbi:hypothetical protein EIP75_10705 [Aquabacterium soli]|uniref:DNA alkylation repair protein n=1 Tax=Aquabacterium soli TaxID=2493092 RepID=A0A3R8YNB1_9BURK|nr:hypothetical protein [Aquabacterium soli]RRS04355.1 hypothetical protein EIP75_10705 [Aquabacterium soli]
MTAAYDLFIKELQADGRERLEGFSTGSFARLTPDERTKVRQALVGLVAQHDMRAPLPLAVLSPEPDTVALLEPLAPAAATAAQATDFELQVLAALALLTGKPLVLDALEGVFTKATDNWKRGIAMDGLRWAQPASDASPRLARLVRSMDDEDLRADAADTLLQRHGWYLTDAATQAEALQLLRALVDGDAAQRDGALVKVLKAPIKPLARP